MLDIDRRRGCEKSAAFVFLPRGQDNGFEIACEADRGRTADALACASDNGDGRPHCASVSLAASRITPTTASRAEYIGL